MLKGFDAVRRAFGHTLHAAVRQIPHVTNNLMPRRGALREKTIAHSLDVSAD